MTSTIAPANEEAIRAWNTVLFDRFVEFRDLMVGGLGAHGDDALELYPPPRGARALDIGCGFGDTAQQIADLVGPDGHVTGLDAAERFIEMARAENVKANADFVVADLQSTALEGQFDYAFSRMGTMFFANPVVALRNVPLKPGGRLCMVVWRNRYDNDWIYRAEVAVKRYLEKPDDSDEPTCGPGPFSMAGADTVSDVLKGAGFTDITLRRNDRDMLIGDSMERAIALNLALGPGAEVVRLLGERAEPALPQIREDLRAGLAAFERPDGSLWGPSSVWIVSAVRAGS
ncbi:MAG: hypothetical protein QOF76_4158 [Solirubrobacteraceae bacterium]|jgi:SAM-dependent methyltransferase|nr:hypothetical protein [Solirubrobacteraceae bacterium]